MKRKIEINNKKYIAECNAFTIIDYRNEFNRDILSDITFINKYLIDSLILSEKIKNGDDISEKIEENNKDMEKFIDILTRITYIVLFNRNDIENYDDWIEEIEKISLEDKWIEEILELVPNIFDYKIVKSIGFPYNIKEITLDRWYAVPVTLESNVIKLHQDLFQEENYKVSETVKEISNKISKRTGYTK